MKLSKHLTLKEATKSATAIKNGIDNQPTIAQLEVLKGARYTYIRALPPIRRRPASSYQRLPRPGA